MSIRAKIISGYVVALVMLVAVGSVAYFSVNRLIASATWTAHTHEVLAAARHLESSLNFAETGARGYVIAGNPFYLDEFNSQVTEARTTLARIKTLTSDNADQQGRLSAVTPQTEQLFSYLSALAALRDKQGLEAAVEAFGEGVGTGSMGAVRAAIREIAGEEELLLSNADGRVPGGGSRDPARSCRRSRRCVPGTRPHVYHRPSEHIWTAAQRHRRSRRGG